MPRTFLEVILKTLYKRGVEGGCGAVCVCVCVCMGASPSGSDSLVGQDIFRRPTPLGRDPVDFFSKRSERREKNEVTRVGEGKFVFRMS